MMGHFVRAPTIISQHRDCRGICGKQPLEIDCNKEGRRGLAKTIPWILANRVHTCRAQEVVLIVASLQNQVRMHTEQGTWWGRDLPDGISKKGVFLGLESGLPMPRQSAESQLHLGWIMITSGS